MKLVEMAFFTDDVEKMAAFYKNLLGKEPDIAADGMAIFMLGTTKLFIHRTYSSSEGELPPDNHIAFAVADVDSACKELIARGVRLEVPPQDYYWGRSAYLRAPDGLQIEITQERPG